MPVLEFDPEAAIGWVRPKPEACFSTCLIDPNRAGRHYREAIETTFHQVPGIIVHDVYDEAHGAAGCDKILDTVAARHPSRSRCGDLLDHNRVRAIVQRDAHTVVRCSATSGIVEPTVVTQLSTPDPSKIEEWRGEHRVAIVQIIRTCLTASVASDISLIATVAGSIGTGIALRVVVEGAFRNAPLPHACIGC